MQCIPSSHNDVLINSLWWCFDQQSWGRRLSSNSRFGWQWLREWLYLSWKDATRHTREVWDVVGEDVETDFPQDQGQLPSVDVNNRSIASRNLKDIVHWLLIFLCLWSSFCKLSDNALEILLSFLRAVFDSLNTLFPLVGSFAMLFPR